GWTSTRSIPALSVSWGPFSHHGNFAGDLCRALGSDLRSEEAPGQGVEGRGLAGAQEAVPGRGYAVATSQVTGHQGGVHVLGGLFGAGDQGDRIAHHVLDDGGQQRVVRAAQYEGVDIGGQDRREVLPGHGQQFGPAGDAALDELHEPRGGGSGQLQGRGGGEGGLVGG